jgi:arsenite methyltransferase
MDFRQIYSAVSERYSALSSTSSPLNAGYGKSVAQSFGYTEEELASIPAESNLGLSCGNPLAIASLREVGPLRNILYVRQ